MREAATGAGEMKKQRMALKRIARLCTAAVAAASWSMPVAWGDCLPPELKAAAPAQADTAAAPPPRGAAAVYLDVSGSMKGFVETQREPRYADIILRLPEALEEVSTATAYNRFGASIQPLPKEHLTDAVKPSFYVCDPRSKDAAKRFGCETHIDEALQSIADSDEQTVSVLITDLFLSRKDLLGTSGGTIREKLSRILKSGKSIAVLGISAAFDGWVYDLPGTAPSYLHKRGERPFFLVLAGQDAQLLRLHKFVAAQLLAVLPANHYHFVLFTRSPGIAATSITPLRVVANEGIRSQGKVPEAPDWLPLITLARGQAPVVARPPLDKLQKPFASPLADFEAHPTVWRDTGGRCETRWKPMGRIDPSIVKAQDDGAGLTLTFDADGLRSFPPNLTFLTRVQVSAVGLTEAKSVTGWLRDWSFNERQADELLKSRPEFFPALNLGEFADSLEAAVKSSFEPTVVIDQVFAFRKGS